MKETVGLSSLRDLVAQLCKKAVSMSNSFRRSATDVAHNSLDPKIQIKLILILFKQTSFECLKTLSGEKFLSSTTHDLNQAGQQQSQRRTLHTNQFFFLLAPFSFYILQPFFSFSFRCEREAKKKLKTFLRFVIIFFSLIDWCAFHDIDNAAN